MEIKHVSAVTLAVRDMTRALAFYQKLGFTVIHGGARSPFSSLQAQEAYVNLMLMPEYEPHWWGRAVFRVNDAQEMYQKAMDTGLEPELPRNGKWGERYFHILDPDGHELSFAELLES